MKNNFPVRSLILFIACTGAVIASFLLWGDAIAAWFDAAMAQSRERPALTAALLYLTLASDILLPIPSNIAATACGALLGPAWGFLTAFMAMNTSCAAGYAIGRYCRGWAARIVGENEIALIERLHRRGGAWLLLALRPVPVLAETSLVFAGIARHPPKRTALECGLGNAIIALVYAVAGAMAATGPLAGILVFAGVIALSALLMLIPKLK